MHTTDILISAPAIFAGEPVSQASKHYKFIPTLQLIEDFSKLGWEVNRVKQQNSHIDPIHTKHMVILRNESLGLVEGNAIEIIMVNSHNRTASFNFMVGLFRPISSSWMIVSDKVFDSLRLRHMGAYNFEDLRALTQNIVDNIPYLEKKIQSMKGVSLTYGQKTNFATDAIATRFPEYVSDRGFVDTDSIGKAINIDSFLTPVREEDKSHSLWITYNRVHEKLLKGDFQRIGSKDGISKKVRPVTNIKLEVDLNKELWELAEAYAEKFK